MQEIRNKCFGSKNLFSPEEGSCYVFSTRNNCCEFLASGGVIFQSFIKPFFKRLIFGASLSSIGVTVKTFLPDFSFLDVCNVLSSPETFNCSSDPQWQKRLPRFGSLMTCVRNRALGGSKD